MLEFFTILGICAAVLYIFVVFIELLVKGIE